MGKEPEYKTFAELGITFQENSQCYTCTGQSCHNNVKHKNGTDYSVHISTDSAHQKFSIFASPSGSAFGPDDIDLDNLDEKTAVSIICKNFDWFSCF